MAPEIDVNVDYYNFLSIEATATDAEIQRAYRKTNLKYHPDKFKATSDITADQAAANLDLLQKILLELKDPAKRAEYDHKREAKRRRVAEDQKMESDRRKRVEVLHEREKMAAIPSVTDLKRHRSEAEQEREEIAGQNKKKRDQMVEQKLEDLTRQKEAAQAQKRQYTPPEPDEKHRSVKVTWIREGEGLDIDEDALREMCERFGPVEHIKVLGDKKRRVDGRKEKTIFATGLVVFVSLFGAQKAVGMASWDGIESVTWAFGKGTDAR